VFIDTVASMYDSGIKQIVPDIAQKALKISIFVDRGRLLLKKMLNGLP
jgi:hypothetical protein